MIIILCMEHHLTFYEVWQKETSLSLKYSIKLNMKQNTCPKACSTGRVGSEKHNGKDRKSQSVTAELDLKLKLPEQHTLLTREHATCAREHNTPQKGLSMPL